MLVTSQWIRGRENTLLGASGGDQCIVREGGLCNIGVCLALKAMSAVVADIIGVCRRAEIDHHNWHHCTLFHLVAVMSVPQHSYSWKHTDNEDTVLPPSLYTDQSPLAHLEVYFPVLWFTDHCASIYRVSSALSISYSDQLWPLYLTIHATTKERRVAEPTAHSVCLWALMCSVTLHYPCLVVWCYYLVKTLTGSDHLERTWH